MAGIEPCHGRQIAERRAGQQVRVRCLGARRERAALHMYPHEVTQVMLPPGRTAQLPGQDVSSRWPERTAFVSR